MKKSLLPILFCLVCFLSANAQNPSDEADIQALVEKETRAWLGGDSKTFANCWQVHPYSRALVSLLDGTCIDVPLDPSMKVAAADMGSGGVTFQNSNYRSHVSGSMAWLNYDEVKTHKDGTKSYSHETRLLEKVGGDWKIVAMTVHEYKP